MKSSELKPKILSELLDLFEHDPTPEARLTVDSIKDCIKEVSIDEINNMLKHLQHVGLIEYVVASGIYCAAINDKGISWLNEHNENLKQQSIKNWLAKPVVVAVVTLFITVPLTTYYQGEKDKQSIQSSPCPEEIQTDKAHDGVQ